jgi:hypothetical protein
LKGLVKRAMLVTGRKQVLGGIKTCITMSSDNLYPSPNLIMVAISKRVIFEENITGAEDI